MADVEKIKKKIKQLEAQVKKVESLEKTKKRKEDTRRKIIIGAAVLSYAAEDPKAKDRLDTILGKFVTNPKDRAFIGLSDTQSPSGSPSAATTTSTVEAANAGTFEVRPDTEI